MTVVYLLHSRKMPRHLHAKPTQLHPGSTLLDTVLSLFVISFMIILVGTLVSAREINRRTLFRAQAAALADEQLNALRRLDVTTLANQTNGAPKNILYNAGTWRVVANTSAGHSSPNVLELAGSSISGAVSGRLLFPAGAYGDGTLSAKWRLVADSPATASMGYLFRSTDQVNSYRVRFARTAVDLDLTTGGTQNVLFEKLVSGVATKIDSRLQTITADTWYTLNLVTSGSSVSLYLDGNQLGAGAFTDATYTTGSAALLGWNGLHAYVDDVQTITTGTQTWNFDADLDLPAAWVRLSINDLPNSTSATFDDNSLLTLSTYPVGSSTTTLKMATIVIQWLANNSTQSYTTSGLLGRSGVGQ